MDLPFFLYRRLARFVTCTLRLPKRGVIRLYDKYQVASFQDVFCHPFYWHALDTLQFEPKLIVDCGAHCGHFSILSDISIRSRFSDARSEFILIEPNRKLVKSFTQNLELAGIRSRCIVVEGLVGKTEGSDTIFVQSANFLTSSTTATLGAKPFHVKYVDLSTYTKGHEIDILKLDIEGAEFDFCHHNEGLLRSVRVLVMEVHHQAGSYDDMTALLGKAGLVQYGQPVEANQNMLAIFTRACPDWNCDHQ